MFTFFRKPKTFNNLQESRLFDETSFYNSFIKDLLGVQKEVIIESPFITASRMILLTPIFKKLLIKGVKIHIITRHPSEHDEHFRYHATEEILKCSELGINVILLKGNHHRKLAILDRTTLWEGSLNILSQSSSKEIMRRIEDKVLALKMLQFLDLKRII